MEPFSGTLVADAGSAKAKGDFWFTTRDPSNTDIGFLSPADGSVVAPGGQGITFPGGFDGNFTCPTVAGQLADAAGNKFTLTGGVWAMA